MLTERRRFPRSTVRTPAEILPLQKGLKAGSAIMCTVVNISEGGALIEVTHGMVPDEFYLLYRGLTLTAQVVGRSGQSLRLAFPVTASDPCHSANEASGEIKYS